MNSVHIDDLRVTLSMARSCYEAWWIADGNDHLPLREDLLKIYNRYIDFFGFVQPALFTVFVLKLGSVFDTRSDCITIKSLPDHETHPKFESIWDRGRILYKYRSKVIAHRDRHVPTRNFAKETGFTYNGLKELIDDTCALFDFCAEKHALDKVYDFSCKSDLELMAHDFKKAMQA